ncbi:MAG TPA: cyclic nucleotide-binding domain-containing protein, partial [Polyangiaceae bacterium]|nr:cyclic nucleotide-binding domain-containing protein [Polyangiaceae bacterium]
LALGAGDVLFEAGDPSDALFVTVSGQLELWSVARGDEAASLVRVVTQDGILGEEAALPGLRRSARAVCGAPARLAEVPFGVLSRALTRAGATSLLDREVRALERSMTKSLLAALSFGRHLDSADLELLLDAVHTRHYEPGQFLQRQGDPPEHCLLLQKGLVQIQSEQDGRVRVHGYLSGGDFFGDEEILAGEPHRYSVVAMGDAVCIHADAAVMRRLCDSNVGLAKRLRRLTLARRPAPSELDTASNLTQHVLRDAYRMQAARSLLAIDQDTCVRCGHCAWACAESHDGVSRLIRSGDKVIVAEAGALANLLLPNTCQHCEHPACMIDCPTGAIGRDVEGEVFIRENLCTGCGACAKACPWHNIQLAPRADLTERAAPAQLSELVAVKCDLCRDYEAPACVRSCPTDALQRLDPRQEFSEVRALFGGATGPAEPPARGAADRAPRPAWQIGAAIGASAAVALFSLVALSLAPAGRVLVFGAGVVAGVGSLLLASHALLKRRVSLWLRPRDTRGLGRTGARSPAGSFLSPWVRAHQSLGLVTLGAAIWHSGFVWPGGASGALLVTLLSLAVTGMFGALCYRLVPRRLSRLEWRGALPEELGRERRELVDRLYRLTSGQDALVKRVTELILVPYSGSIWESLRLLVSGRDLKQERARLRRVIDERLEGRGRERLLVIDDIIKVVVDLRALP